MPLSSRSLVSVVALLCGLLHFNDAFVPAAGPRRLARCQKLSYRSLVVVRAQETQEPPKADDQAIGPVMGPALGPEAPKPAPPSQGLGAEVEVAPAEELPLTDEEKERAEKLAKIEALKAKEVFQKKETGDYECQVCGWEYKETNGFGDSIPPGTAFASLPSSFACPKCKAPKSAFQPVTVTIAGFSDNSKYGFGGNSLTGDQKGFLIFGGLGFFFLLFLAGYLLE